MDIGSYLVHKKRIINPKDENCKIYKITNFYNSYEVESLTDSYRFHVGVYEINDLFEEVIPAEIGLTVNVGKDIGRIMHIHDNSISIDIFVRQVDLPFSDTFEVRGCKKVDIFYEYNGKKVLANGYKVVTPFKNEDNKMKPKFKVGDKVKIVSKPPIDKDEFPRWIDSMNVLCGKIDTISKIDYLEDTLIYKLEHADKYFKENWLETIHNKILGWPSNAKFQYEDRVFYYNPKDDKDIWGNATVIGIGYNNEILLEFDKENLLCHDGSLGMLKYGRKGKNRHCWYISEDYQKYIQKISENKEKTIGEHYVEPSFYVEIKSPVHLESGQFFIYNQFNIIPYLKEILTGLKGLKIFQKKKIQKQLIENADKINEIINSEFWETGKLPNKKQVLALNKKIQIKED